MQIIVTEKVWTQQRGKVDTTTKTGVTLRACADTRSMYDRTHRVLRNSPFQLLVQGHVVTFVIIATEPAAINTINQRHGTQKHTCGVVCGRTPSGLAGADGVSENLQRRGYCHYLHRRPSYYYPGQHWNNLVLHTFQTLHTHHKTSQSKRKKAGRALYKPGLGDGYAAVADGSSRHFHRPKFGHCRPSSHHLYFSYSFFCQRGNHQKVVRRSHHRRCRSQTLLKNHDWVLCVADGDGAGDRYCCC